MAENESGQEKTQDPTPKRLEKSREEGQVARSKDLTTTLVMLSGVGGLLVFGGDIARALMGLMTFNFSMSPAVAFDQKLMMAHFAESSYAAISSLVSFFILLVISAMLGPVALGGFIFSAKSLWPKFERIDPIKGLKRLFSLNALVELVKAIGKIALVGGVAVVMLVHFQTDLLNLAQGRLENSLGHMLEIIGWSILAVSASLIFIAMIDVPYQIFDHQSKLKMTFQEVRDEMKDIEGKPEVKSKVRQLQMEAAQRRMMEAVPDADVVITNPEHFSVALKYDVDGGGAPMVVAKGVDFLAIKIREIANAHDVLIMEAPPLARAIYFTTEIDEEIPSTLYLAVAQVLAYVFQLRAHKEGAARRPKPLAEIEVPRDVLYDPEGNPIPEEAPDL